jgi:hypothetical protein
MIPSARGRYHTVNVGNYVFLFSFFCACLNVLATVLLGIVRWSKEYRTSRIRKMRDYMPWRLDLFNRFFWMRSPGPEYAWLERRFKDQVPPSSRQAGCPVQAATAAVCTIAV